MGSTKLKDDLSNCLINFDRRVLITELLDDYQLAYEEVNKVLNNFVEEQEKKDKLKFNKRFLVHGVQQGEHKKEIYKIVEEPKLKEWLKKLENAQSSLYSVEVSGGAKSAAAVFKPMSVKKEVKLRSIKRTKASTPNVVPETSKPVKDVEKKEVKHENSTNKAIKESPKKLFKSNAKVEASAKKTSPKTETSPADKAADKKSAQRKGINNFFAQSTAGSKKSEDTKASKTAIGVVKPSTPKKMVDFFKKQAEKPKTSAEILKKAEANTSVQLFDDEEEEDPEEISSDEEEKLEALKRDIITSDVEMDAEEDEDAKPSNSSKRRRILDSDEEEEDPPVKQEKLDMEEETKEEEAAAETYLDEDGFVITKKPKQKATTKSNKSPATKKTPPVTLKTSLKDINKSSTSSNKDTKPATNPTAKTKQPRIMNLFTKK